MARKHCCCPPKAARPITSFSAIAYSWSTGEYLWHHDASSGVDTGAGIVPVGGQILTLDTQYMRVIDPDGYVRSTDIERPEEVYLFNPGPVRPATSLGYQRYGFVGGKCYAAGVNDDDELTFWSVSESGWTFEINTEILISNLRDIRFTSDDICILYVPGSTADNIAWVKFLFSGLQFSSNDNRWYPTFGTALIEPSEVSGLWHMSGNNFVRGQRTLVGGASMNYWSWFNVCYPDATTPMMQLIDPYALHQGTSPTSGAGGRVKLCSDNSIWVWQNVSSINTGAHPLDWHTSLARYASNYPAFDASTPVGFGSPQSATTELGYRPYATTSRRTHILPDDSVIYSEVNASTGSDPVLMRLTTGWTVSWSKAYSASNVNETWLFGSDLLVTSNESSGGYTKKMERINAMTGNVVWSKRLSANLTEGTHGFIWHNPAADQIVTFARYSSLAANNLPFYITR